jgi:carboxyl-terminal processing protease
MKSWLDIILRVSIVVLLVSLVTGAAFLAGFGTGALYESVASARRASPPTIESTTPPLVTPPAPTAAPPSPSAEATSPPPTAVVTTPQRPDRPTPTDEELRTAFEVFWEAWQLVEQEYYGEMPDANQVTYGAIRGALQTLGDDYTSFIEPSISNILREDASGSFEGIGALVRMNEQNRLEIVRPFEDQPAAEAGLMPGDVVLAVDGASIIGKGIYEAIGLIRGPEGTQVTLTIERPGRDDRFDVTITRARIEIPIVAARMIGDDIAYVSLAEFSGQATQQLREALGDLLGQNPKGVILDLRDNPGGLLREAVDVADLFLDEGVVLIERSSDGTTQTYRSTGEGIGQNIPLVVLVNAGSASASEIVAGAIQDRDRGQLVGETTFGKGSVQLPHQLSDGSELRVTIARWFTPNDRAIHGTGLEPDIAVERTADDINADRDPQLDRAVELLRESANGS